MRRLAFAGGLAALIGAAPVASHGVGDWVVRTPHRADRTGWFADPRLTESSGAAGSPGQPGVIWSMNDSGNEPLLFATDTLGADLGSFTVTGAANRDWEDIAAGPCDGVTCLYIADTGDNTESRPEVELFRVPEPAAAAGARGATAPAERLRIRYPDAPHDVEAMLVDRHGDVHLVTKGRSGGVLHFRVPQAAWGAAEPAVAEALESLPLDPEGSPSDRVTGAALSPGGEVAVIRTYRRLHFFRLDPAGRLVPHGTPPLACSVAGLEPQGEGVTWLDAERLVLTSERFLGLAAGAIHVVECPGR